MCSISLFCFTLIKNVLFSEVKCENLLGGRDIHIATHLLDETTKQNEINKNESCRFARSAVLSEPDGISALKHN